MKEMVLCLFCKKIFLAHSSGVRKYCSRACYTKHTSKTVYNKQCPACHKEYNTFVKNQKYCCCRCTAIGSAKLKQGVGKYKQRARGRHRVQVGDRRVDFHRHIYEQELSRKLTPNETVHHIDCDCANDDRCNLHLYPNQSTHQKGHFSLLALVPNLLNEGYIVFEKGTYLIATAKRRPK